MNSEYLEFAKSLAVNAGEVMKAYFGTENSMPDWKKANDPVTAADKSINTLVINKILAKYPEHGILGEEETQNAEAENLWVVDPVDGTIPFILGLPVSTFLIALVVEGRPKVAVAYNPWIDLFYCAQEGKGAYRNDVKLKVTKPSTKFIEFIYWRSSPFWAELKGVGGRLESAGLSPQNFAGGNSRYGVADNRLYGVIFSGQDPWDIAVLDLVVHEAGGKVTDLDGRQIDYRGPIRGAVAGTQKTHTELMDIIKNAHNRD